MTALPLSMKQFDQTLMWRHLAVWDLAHDGREAINTFPCELRSETASELALSNCADDLYLFIFLMWIIFFFFFKVFIEFVTVLLLFYVLVFWQRGVWDLSSPTRDRTHTRCIGRRSTALTTGPPGRSHVLMNFR